MSNGQGTAGGRAPARHAKEPPPLSAWVGAVAFAAVIMILLGLWNIIDGLIALTNDKYYTVGPSGLLVLDITGWGWLLLILGIVELAAGFALFSGATWARVVTVVVAAFNGLVQFGFIAAYPVGAVLIMVLSGLVIWAVVVHAGELRDS